ncbi:MAG: hypothetical protein LUG83_03685 [Lachnospiraceae bacterium]|nr:hypothetical protein [Lachnospiraceae bacterium]
MERDEEYMHRIMMENKETVMPLLRYLPWLMQHAGESASSDYNGDGLAEHSISFPVYDSTLLGFIREASQSPLMDKNYPYVYTRSHLKTHEDERRVIEMATWKEWDILRGILSKYVLGGRVKSVLWSEAVKENIFYLVLKRMKEIIEFWDKPIENI